MLDHIGPILSGSPPQNLQLVDLKLTQIILKTDWFLEIVGKHLVRLRLGFRKLSI